MYCVRNGGHSTKGLLYCICYETTYDGCIAYKYFLRPQCNLIKFKEAL